MPHYVFLSWTVRHHRDPGAMRAIISALDKQGIGYFDYTRNEFDDAEDHTEEIQQLLKENIERCDCSIEIISRDILPQEWVQYERGLLRKYEKRRFFLCLDEVYMDTVSDKEGRITRLNFSDGRFGMSVADDLSYGNAAYFLSASYNSKCDRFAAMLRNALDTRNWKQIETDRAFGKKPLFRRTSPTLDPKPVLFPFLALCAVCAVAVAMVALEQVRTNARDVSFAVLLVCCFLELWLGKRIADNFVATDRIGLGKVTNVASLLIFALLVAAWYWVR